MYYHLRTHLPTHTLSTIIIWLCAQYPLLIACIADIDECLEEADSCHHMCTNTNGSYTCQCLQGFRLEVDGLSCIGMLNYNIKVSIDSNFLFILC